MTNAFEYKGELLMNILSEKNHRPFPLRSNKWIMQQNWRDVIFLHWPVHPDQLRPYIPAPLKIDTFDHFAWLGIVAFVMEGIYPRGLPFITVTPKFSEVNVRTYVQYKDKPGVCFLSLDVENWASNMIAKRWYRLPYYPAEIIFLSEGNAIHCRSTRKAKSSQPILFHGSVTPSQDLSIARIGTLNHWLTERYCFYSMDTKGGIYCGEIHHRPWMLQKAETEIEMNTLFDPINLNPSNEKPIAAFSKGINSLIWNIKKVRMQ